MRADADLSGVGPSALQTLREIKPGSFIFERAAALPPAFCDEVVRRFDLARALRPFTRCSACNERLCEADAADLTGRAPAGILATHDRLLECPGCKRVYWKGSHTRRIQGVVDRLLAAR